MSNDLQTRPMATVFRLREYRRRRNIFFSRPELNRLLSLYSRQVARGEWRDYAIDQRDGAALFSVFRHTQEAALGRQVLATGSSLGEVLTTLQRRLRPPTVLLDGAGSFPLGSHSTPGG
jgi:hypothetical protein